MKYHSLPSLSDLKAYRQGRLSSDERSWIDTVLRENPLVKEVYRNVETTNSAAVHRVSSSVSNRIIETYIPNRGFWSKYAGWIGLSSIVLILGSIYFFNNESISPKYFVEQSTLSIEEPSGFKGVSLVTSDNSQDNQKENSSNQLNDPLVDGTSEAVGSENKADKINGLNPIHSFEMPAPTGLQFKKSENENSLKEPEIKEPDNTRGFESNESKEKTGTILLAVNSVNILSKLNPDDYTTRSRSTGGNDPLGRGDTKRQSNASYSIDDLPSFPGGDQALINYFKGQLRPIKIPAKADKFDRSVMIELELNSRGKLKDYKIFGNLHPTHQEQLEKAIDELPQFEKGNGEKVKYSLAISF